MLTRKQKEEIISDLSDKIGKTKSMVFVEFTGMETGEMGELRRELKKNKAELKVAKKTLVELALGKHDFKVDLDKFKTQVAVAFGYNDEFSAVKALDNFAKKHSALKLLAGFIGKDYYEQSALAVLAKLPSREELLARLVGTISAPVSGFVNVLQGNMRGLVTVLSKIKQ